MTEFINAIVHRKQILQMTVWDFFSYNLMFLAVACINAESIASTIASGGLWKIALIYAAFFALAVGFITWRYAKDYANAPPNENS